ncbi:serpin B8 [Halyomorpha halys]|uniref:serpin B8 n=1 Tax=Halyomorpha halys TaxID=286706 RepID=UPI0006D4F888|nr:serpin B8 [Halyomorpha halys]
MARSDAPPIAVFIIALLCTGCTGKIEQFMSESTNQFAFDLYKAVQSHSENVVVSPISLQIILALMQQGARNTTTAEIAGVLQHSVPNALLLEGYKSLITDLRSPVLKIVTKMFIEKTSKVFPDFQSIASNYFLSEIRGLDFKGNPEGSRVKINDWIEEHTYDKIKDLFPSGSLTSSTRLVLANAVYLKALWKYPFDKMFTREGQFFISSDEVVTVQMMALVQESLPHMYSIKLKSQMIELPYKEEGYRMVIILPDDYNGLAALESKLTYTDFFTEASKLVRKEIDVFLPRFKVEESMDLAEILRKMGMPTAFSNSADFSRISNEALKIDKVIQKALIEVTEEGTEVAIGSAFSVQLVSLPRRVRCNHPFIYMILKGNTILFVGRLLRPMSQAEKTRIVFPEEPMSRFV